MWEGGKREREKRISKEKRELCGWGRVWELVNSVSINIGGLPRTSQTISIHKNLPEHFSHGSHGRNIPSTEVLVEFICFTVFGSLF